MKNPVLLILVALASAAAGYHYAIHISPPELKIPEISNHPGRFIMPSGTQMPILLDTQTGELWSYDPSEKGGMFHWRKQWVMPQ